MTPMDLLNHAVRAREKSYSPYSNYRVGAALLGADGQIYTGCNIENAAYPATVCAERTALFKGISEGCRAFAALAVVGGPAGTASPNGLGDYAFPCGVCRQALAEFCPPEMPVYLLNDANDVKICTMGDLLPNSFSAASMARKEDAYADDGTD